MIGEVVVLRPLPSSVAYSSGSYGPPDRVILLIIDEGGEA